MTVITAARLLFSVFKLHKLYINCKLLITDKFLNQVCCNSFERKNNSNTVCSPGKGVEQARTFVYLTVTLSEPPDKLYSYAEKTILAPAQCLGHSDIHLVVGCGKTPAIYCCVE